jgi:hypothetical protein
VGDLACPETSLYTFWRQFVSPLTTGTTSKVSLTLFAVLNSFKGVNYFFLTINLVALGLSVASVEKTITLNYISDVSKANLASYGQLLPLSIGGFTLIKAVLDLLRANREMFKALVRKVEGQSSNRSDHGFDSATGSSSGSSSGTRSSKTKRKQHPPFTRRGQSDGFDSFHSSILALLFPWLLYWRPAPPSGAEAQQARLSRITTSRASRNNGHRAMTSVNGHV